MAKYRQLRTEFWHDGFVMDLTPEEKYFYLYLMTNIKTTQCGIYEIPLQLMSVEIGYNRETIEKLIERFESYEKIIYSRETKEIYIVNWMRYNSPNNTNAMKCVNSELKKVKDKNILLSLYNQCIELELDIDNLFQGVSVGETSIEAHTKEVCSQNQGACDTLSRDYEGAYEGLASNEIINNKQKIINKKVINNSSSSSVYDKANNINNTQSKAVSNEYMDKEEDDSFQKVIQMFNKNIHPITPIEAQDIRAWCNDLGCPIVIMAIEESVRYNARNIRYIDKVLKDWKERGLTSKENVEQARKQWINNNAKGDSKVGFCDFQQRNYDFEQLEELLLSGGNRNGE